MSNTEGRHTEKKHCGTSVPTGCWFVGCYIINLGYFYIPALEIVPGERGDSHQAAPASIARCIWGSCYNPGRRHTWHFPHLSLFLHQRRWPQGPLLQPWPVPRPWRLAQCLGGCFYSFSPRAFSMAMLSRLHQDLQCKECLCF